MLPETMPREIAFHGVYMPTMTLMFLFALGLAWGLDRYPCTLR